MSAGRSTRRGYAYAGSVPVKDHHSSSIGGAPMVLVATLVLVVVAALSDPVLLASLVRAIGVAWTSLLALVAQR